MPLKFAEATPEAYDFPLTIGHLLDAALICAPEQEIVYRDKVRLSYREMRERIGRFASMLTELGANEGSVVAVLDWDSHRYLEAYFAVPMLGAVLQTVNIRLAAEQIKYTLRHAGAEFVICHRDFFDVLKPMLLDLPQIRSVIAIDDGAGLDLPAFACGEYETLLASADPAFAFHDFDENALATTFYTTGTTGGPKGVSFSHRQIVLLVLASKAPFGVGLTPGFGGTDVYMPLTPMFHVHAWGLPYIATMMGTKQVYPGRYEPEMICKLREIEKVTYSHCVPTILQMVLAQAGKSEFDLSGWTMTIGGSALTKTLWREATARGMIIHAGYGMSETAPTLTYARRDTFSPSGDESDALTLAGVPIPLVSIRIVDDEMRELPRDGVTRGELVVRAPWLTKGYVGQPHVSSELWRGGWLHTQDVATIDPHGRVTICDRIKDVIKTGGEWVSSLELEDLIGAVPGVAEVAVIGVPDIKWGERPLAFVVPNPGAMLTLETINQPIEGLVADGKLSRYARVDRLKVRESLPRTSVGKIDKKALRSTLLQD